MAAGAGQFVLPVGLSDGAALANFVAGRNREAIDRLEALLAGSGERFLYYCGARGTGKSHLLQAACRCLSERGHASAYVPLRDAASLHPRLLGGLDQVALVCLDDLDSVAGEAAWEGALFHLFNRTAEAGTRLLVAARVAPSALELRLPDLASRLASGLVLRLRPLHDDDRRAALQRRAEQRGFHISDAVVGYLLRRESRDMHALFALLERLDRASLRAKRRVTIPFVRSVIEGD